MYDSYLNLCFTCSIHEHACVNDMLTFKLGRPCSKLSFGPGNIVCRCNASYCDTVEPIEPLTSGNFALYTSNSNGSRLVKSVGSLSKSTAGGKMLASVYLFSSCVYNPLFSRNVTCF